MSNRRGNGEGTISQRKDGLWEGKVTIMYDHATGQTKRKTIYGKTRADVQSKMLKVKAELQQGIYVDTNKITVSEWLDKWIDLYAKPNVRCSTWESYETTIRVHIKPSIGSILLQSLRPEHLQRMYNEKLKSGRIRGEGGLSPKTVAYIHAVIHMALQQALREQLVIRNVAEAVRRPKQKKYEIAPLSIEQMQTLLTVAESHRVHLPLLIECSTGLRRGELLGLQWNDLDFTGSVSPSV